jgi:hypothetical protein
MPDDRLAVARATPPRWRRALRPLLWLALACAVVYAVGGPGSYRRARRWVRDFMRPPTPAEIQRVDTSRAAQAAAPAQLPSGADYYGSKPPSALTMAAVIVGVIGVALLLALATGRRRHRAPRPAADRGVG